MNTVTFHGYLLLAPGLKKSDSCYVSFFTRNYGRVKLFASHSRKKYSSLSLLRQPFIFFLVSARGREGLYYPQEVGGEYSFSALTYQWHVYKMGLFILGLQQEILVPDDISPRVYWGFLALCRNLSQHYSPVAKTLLVLRFSVFLVSELGFDRESICRTFEKLPEFTVQECRYLRAIIIYKQYPPSLNEESARLLLLKTRTAWEYLFDTPLKSYNYL